MSQLIDNLTQEGYLKTPRIIDAFQKVERADFLPDELKAQAEVNAPLPIGAGQTISQPLTVAVLLELLQPEEGEKILDVGTGSGWQTALIAEIVGPKGQVFTTEIVPELYEFGRDNIETAGYQNTQFKLSKGEVGWAEHAPYDKIITAAAAPDIPYEFKDQVKIGGRIVAPIGEDVQEVAVLDKAGEDEFKKASHPGYRFVPLVRKPPDQ
jgi:protein-L-isoaspartate(D-aspartate) O-methyltransferase